MKKMPYIMEMLIALVILPLSGFVDDQGGSQQLHGHQVNVTSPISDQSGHQEIPASLVTAVLLDL